MCAGLARFYGIHNAVQMPASDTVWVKLLERTGAFPTLTAKAKEAKLEHLERVTVAQFSDPVFMRNGYMFCAWWQAEEAYFSMLLLTHRTTSCSFIVLETTDEGYTYSPSTTKLADIKSGRSKLYVYKDTYMPSIKDPELKRRAQRKK